MSDHSETVPEERQASIREIALALASTGDEALIEEFLFSILTPAEAENIATRWELVKLMDRGVSQRKIAERLGLSLCKITRGSKELKREDSPFGRMIRLFEANRPEPPQE
jgi:TrpR family transcriptional regulator, trp operon repressor